MSALLKYMSENPWKDVPTPGDVFTWKKGEIRVLSTALYPANMDDNAETEAINRIEILFSYEDDYYTIRGVEFSETIRWNHHTLTQEKPLYTLTEQSIWGGYGTDQFLPYVKKADHDR